ncbi:PqqD family protein [Novosphingobium sp.]|uniref:PqqD family protein n=1 Tax=Novosphingobium sp. TaxID=1874826 RepID=UPI0025F8DC52|nr:PqqD family protein [Novosphingobium sp.]
MSSVLVKNSAAFSETTIDGEVVVMSLDTGTFYSLTGSAAATWALIDGTRDYTALLDDLAAHFKTSPSLIGADTDAFIKSLVEAGLIAGG